LIESDIQVNPAISTAGGRAGFRIMPGCAGLSGMTPFANCDPVWKDGIQFFQLLMDAGSIPA